MTCNAGRAPGLPVVETKRGSVGDEEVVWVPEPCGRGRLVEIASIIAFNNVNVSCRNTVSLRGSWTIVPPVGTNPVGTNPVGTTVVPPVGTNVHDPLVTFLNSSKSLVASSGCMLVVSR